MASAYFSADGALSDRSHFPEKQSRCEMIQIMQLALHMLDILKDT